MQHIRSFPKIAFRGPEVQRYEICFKNMVFRFFQRCFGFHPMQKQVDQKGLWFQDDHTLNHIKFQIDHGKIIEKKRKIYI